MSVQKTLTIALIIAPTLSVATTVSVLMDTLWNLTSTLAMVSTTNILEIPSHCAL